MNHTISRRYARLYDITPYNLYQLLEGLAEVNMHRKILSYGSKLYKRLD